MNYSLNIKIDNDLAWKLCIFFCASAIFLFLPVSNLFAAEETVISGVLCNVVTTLTGKVGKGIATIAIVFLAIGLFLGKLSWGVALATAIGIAGIFGAGQIVSFLGGDNASEDVCAGQS